MAGEIRIYGFGGDDEWWANFATLTLLDAGYQVTVTPSGHKLDIAAITAADIILVGAESTDVWTRVPAESRKKTVIFTRGGISEQAMTQLRNAGFLVIEDKPYTINRLARLVAYWLRQIKRQHQ